MTDQKDNFYSDRFYFDLDAARSARGLTWKQVGAAAKVNPSTLSRMSQGQRPDANALASLAAWSGLNPADYVAHIERAARPDTLTQIASSLSQDPNLSLESAAVIRETIQKLYDALMTKPKGP
jgi:transcriptional regulator with XRE-family HTH domain